MSRLGWRAWALAGFLLAAPSGVAHAQVFVAERPHPAFTVGPLFVRARVAPELGPVVVDVLWSLTVPTGRSAAELGQSLYLLWPSALLADAGAGRPDPALARYVEARGFTVIDEGRLPLQARNVAQTGRRAPPEIIAGGAPFVTFVREGGALGLSAPATWIHLPWNPRFVDRAWLVDLRLTTTGLLKRKPGTWVEHTFWGPRHRLSLSFFDVRQRVLFPMYFVHRDRVVRLAEDPAQLIVNFAQADRLKIDELYPQSAKRQLSESLENTETVSLFLERSEGLTPQVLTVQFGYFTGLQSWAPILIPALFFILGNLAGPLIAGAIKSLARTLGARVHLGRAGGQPVRDSGVVVSREALTRLVPGETTYDQVIALCGPRGEESEQLGAPDRRTLSYRGRRIVPNRRRTLGWLATVSHWDVEHHEVEIELERGVVRDVQARVRRSRLPHPDMG